MGDKHCWNPKAPSKYFGLKCNKRLFKKISATVDTQEKICLNKMKAVLKWKEHLINPRLREKV